MADNTTPRHTAQQLSAANNLHSHAGGSGELQPQLPREAPPAVAAAAAANSPMQSNLSSQPSQTHPQPDNQSSSSSSLPQPPFLQTPQVSVNVPHSTTNTNHTSDKMDSSAVPMQDTKSVAETTVSGSGTGAGTGGNTLAAASSSTAANANTPQVRAGGAPVRVFMNEKIAPYLLEGMKVVVRDQPPDPLRVLGEFLIQKSKEVEGNGSAGTKSTE
ncbi:hypothetical protein DTO271G3_8377 [Paecilomyces variotii]|nr:hypothetical protein DTO271G3_8377 [Paecilomyces variotii]